jgi:integrase
MMAGSKWRQLKGGLFYFLTGLRRSEVIGLRGEDLEEEGGTLLIKYQYKGGKFTAREVSHPAAYEAAADYLEPATDPAHLHPAASAKPER